MKHLFYHFSFGLLLIVSILLGACYTSDDSTNNYPPEVNLLRSQVIGKWVADMDLDKENDIAVLQYTFSNQGSSNCQLVTLSVKGDDISYNLDSTGIKWDIERNYLGYKNAGITGNAIKITTPDEESIYLIVQKITPDSMYCQVATGTMYTTVNFSRVLEDIDISDLQVSKDFTQDDSIPQGENENTLLLSKWMSNVAPQTKVCQMSIPGSHDAMTFNVSDQVAFAAKSQDLNLRGQWNNGIRVFDFRVRNNGSSVNLYHNFISCNKTFDKSLEELIELVKEHKTSEGAILIIKTEGNDFADNTSSFSSLISWLVDMMTDLEINLSSTKLDQGKTLSYIKAIMERKLIYSDSLFIDFSPNITMGQLKGHIMVINRNDLDISNSLGARATGWDLNCKLYDTKTSTVLNVQDDWGEGKNQSEKEWYTAKYNKFNSLWEQSANTSAEDSTWYVNAASGYITELSVFPNYATAAEELYPAFTQTIQSKPNGHGIVLQDYSGCDRTCRISAKVTMGIALTTQVLPSFMGIRAKALRLALEGARKIASDDIVRGQQLTNAVIESNFQ